VAELVRELQPNRLIKLAINEWGLDLPEPRQYSMESALYGARLMNVFERSGDLVAMSAVSDLVNGWPGGIIQASRHGVFVSPLYLVNELYNNRLGAHRLGAEVESPTFESSGEGKSVHSLDVVVSRSADMKKIFIKAVNTDWARPINTSISLQGVGVAGGAEIDTIMASSASASNSFSTPDAIQIKRSQIKAGSSFVVEFPKQSVSVITLHVRE
jgi:alpha-L-arabinofuranosidase